MLSHPIYPPESRSTPVRGSAVNLRCIVSQYSLQNVVLTPTGADSSQDMRPFSGAGGGASPHVRGSGGIIIMVTHHFMGSVGTWQDVGGGGDAENGAETHKHKKYCQATTSRKGWIKYWSLTLVVVVTFPPWWLWLWTGHLPWSSSLSCLMVRDTSCLEMRTGDITQRPPLQLHCRDGQ